ncbi:MAG: YqjF family protein [Haloarculaceae archaeon]
MAASSLLTLRMADVAFVHWPVDPALVIPKLPAGLTVDTHDGEAYLSVVGLRMADVSPPGVPVGRTFAQVNVRTYVTGDEGPGVYFLSLDADAPLGVAVARRLFDLDYHRADVALDWRDGRLELSSTRRTDAGAVRFDATVEPTGGLAEPDRDDLTPFLVERRLFYASGGDRLYVGRVDHPAWSLQDADVTIHENELLGANGFDVPDAAPIAQYSPGVETTVEGIRPRSLPFVGRQALRPAANRK